MAKKDETAVETAEVKESEKIAAEAKALGIKPSRVSLSGFKDKSPDKLAKEEARNKKLIEKRLKGRVAQAKENAKKKPIEKRRGLLVARLKAVKSRRRPNTYSDANIKAWIEELDLIDNNPKSWNKATANGTKPYTPGNKKKRTARDILDGMDLDD